MFLTFIITAINIITVFLLFWAFRRPEEIIVPGRKKKTILFIALFYSILALLPFLEGKGEGLYYFFVVYPLLYAVVFRNSLRRIFQPHVSKWFFLFSIIFLLLWIEEIPLAVGYVIDGVGEYQNWISVWRHLVSYAGFYVGLALTIVLFFRRWNYSPVEIFTVGGIWGIAIEQYFLGPQLLFSGAVLEFIAFASFIFPTYGLYLIGPYVLFYEEFKSEKPKIKWQSALLFVGVFTLTLAMWFLFGVLLKLIGAEVSGVI